MKIMKKVAALMLALFLAVPGFSMVVSAADGTVSFTDPQTKTGESVEVACALRAGGTLKEFNVTLKYDPSFLSYESGDNGVSKVSDGVIKFSGSGDGTSKIRFTMKFQALKEGTTKIEVTESSAQLTNGGSVTCKNGSSAVSIAQGTEPVTAPSEDAPEEGSEGNVEIVIDGKSYTFSEEFSSSEIPVGFSEGTMTYDGGERKIVQNESGTVKLGYLSDEEGKGNFFLYNEEDATFSPYIQVTVSPTTSITLLKADDSLKIPKGYMEVKLTVDEHEFPAWQDENNEGFYLVYAMNSKGEKCFYQYDVEEESYQRYIGKADAPAENNTKVGKIASFVDEHQTVVLLGVGLGIILLIIIIIVLVIKLRHRNLELDDLYEEYEIEDEEEEEILPVKEDRKEKRSQFKRQPKEEEEFFDDDFDEEDDDFEIRDFDEDEEDDEDFDDFEYEDKSNDYEESKEFLDNEDFDFDVDDFEVDFIDLD